VGEARCPKGRGSRLESGQGICRDALGRDGKRVRMAKKNKRPITRDCATWRRKRSGEADPLRRYRPRGKTSKRRKGENIIVDVMSAGTGIGMVEMGEDGECDTMLMHAMSASYSPSMRATRASGEEVELWFASVTARHNLSSQARPESARAAHLCEKATHMQPLAHPVHVDLQTLEDGATTSRADRYRTQQPLRAFGQPIGNLART
jgi:hypothetical protein